MVCAHILEMRSFSRVGFLVNFEKILECYRSTFQECCVVKMKIQFK